MKKTTEDYCDFCQRKTPHVAVFEYGLMFETPTGASRCQECQFIHMSPMPSDDNIKSMYTDDNVYNYISDLKSDYNNVINDKLKFIQWVIKTAGGPPKNMTHLDIGSGMGALVYAMGLSGFDASGVDWQIAAVDASRRIFGITVVQGGLDQVDRRNLGAVTMCDCFEHVPRPSEVLADIRAIMADDGILFGNVPNFDSLDRILHGADSDVALRNHLNLFTPKSLRRMLEKNGFDVKFCGYVVPYAAAFTWGIRSKFRRWRDGMTRGGAGARLMDIAIDLATKAKRHLLYPLVNLFIVKTGLFGQAIVFVARPSAASPVLPAA